MYSEITKKTNFSSFSLHMSEIIFTSFLLNKQSNIVEKTE